MVANETWIKDIAAQIGEEQVSPDLPTRITYRAAHGPESLLHEDQHDFTPAVVLRPRSTEDMVEIVKRMTPPLNIVAPIIPIEIQNILVFQRSLFPISVNSIKLAKVPLEINASKSGTIIRMDNRKVELKRI